MNNLTTIYGSKRKGNLITDLTYFSDQQEYHPYAP